MIRAYATRQLSSRGDTATDDLVLVRLVHLWASLVVKMAVLNIPVDLEDDLDEGDSVNDFDSMEERRRSRTAAKSKRNSRQATSPVNSTEVLSVPSLCRWLSDLLPYALEEARRDKDEVVDNVDNFSSALTHERPSSSSPAAKKKRQLVDRAGSRPAQSSHHQRLARQLSAAILLVLTDALLLGVEGLSAFLLEWIEPVRQEVVEWGGEGEAPPVALTQSIDVFRPVLRRLGNLLKAGKGRVAKSERATLLTSLDIIFSFDSTGPAL